MELLINDILEKKKPTSDAKAKFVSAYFDVLDTLNLLLEQI